jgi:hypothetical protein
VEDDVNAQQIETVIAKLKQQHKLTLLTLANGHAPYSSAKSVHGRLRNLGLLDENGAVTDFGRVVVTELRVRLDAEVEATRAAAREAAQASPRPRGEKLQFAASSTWK